MDYHSANARAHLEQVQAAREAWEAAKQLLYDRAAALHPDDPNARRREYIRLLRSTGLYRRFPKQPFLRPPSQRKRRLVIPKEDA